VESARNSDGTERTKICLVQANPISATSISSFDYGAFVGEEGMERVAVSSLSRGKYNYFPMSSPGLSWISKIGAVSLGLRTSWDIDDVDPSSVSSFYDSGFNGYSSEEAGRDKDPYLFF